MGKYSSIILAAIMIVSFGAYADAQNMSYRFSGYGYRQSPEVNRYLSARYDHLLQVSIRFRSHSHDRCLEEQAFMGPDRRQRPGDSAGTRESRGSDHKGNFNHRTG